MKISIDFDATLTLNEVQSFVKRMISDGNEVWVVTSRYTTEFALTQGWSWVEEQNNSLFELTDSIGIIRSNIHFTNNSDKIVFLKGKGFSFHLDDNENELVKIRISGDKCLPMNVCLSSWEEVLNETFNLKKDVS